MASPASKQSAGTQQSARRGPLQTVRVLVLGEGSSAGTVGTLLADYGADVVRLEPPEGVAARHEFPDGHDGSLLWPSAGRNTRSVVLDLNDPATREIALRLAGAADIVIDDLSSGAAQWWGRRLDALRAASPQTIILTLSPFGITGPRATQPGSEIAAEALGGLAHITGHPAREPLHSDYPVGIAVTALFGALSVMAALYEREHRRSGGCHIDLGSAEAILRILEFLPAYYSQLGWVSDRTNSTSDYQVPVNRWKTKDGIWMSFTGNTGDIVHRFFRAIDHSDYVDDARFATNSARVENREALEEAIATWFSDHTLAEAEAAMEREKVPIAAILSMREIFGDPQYAARGAIAEVETPAAGAVRMPNVAGRFSRTPGAIRHPGRALGADTQEVLSEWLQGGGGLGAGAVSADRAGYPSPLHGLRVLDIGNVIAGPFTATLLADLGADVVKVERPETGDMFRRQAPLKEGLSVWWKVGGRGKRSIALDLKDAADRETFLELARHADVLVENFVPGVAESLGVDAARLSEVNPRLVYVSISGYGQDGPRSRSRAFGRNAEAFSGMASMTGYPGDVPQHTGFPVADAFSALFAAFGALSAVHERDVGASNAGQHVDVALFESVFRFMEPQVALFAKTGESWTRGTSCTYPARWRRVLPTSDDRWLSVSVNEEAPLDLVATWFGTTPEVLLDPRVDLGDHSRTSGLTQLESSAAAAGVPNAPVTTIEDLIDDPQMGDRQMLITVQDPELGDFLMPAVVPLFDGRRPVIQGPAPRLDAHRGAILSDWGIRHVKAQA